jgi:hypothetical protein
LKKNNIHCVEDLRLFVKITLDAVIKNFMISFFSDGSISFLFLVLADTWNGNMHTLFDLCQKNKKKYYLGNFVLVVFLLKLLQDYFSSVELVKDTNLNNNVFSDQVVREVLALHEKAFLEDYLLFDFSKSVFLDYTFDDFLQECFLMLSNIRDQLKNDIEQGDEQRLLVNIVSVEKILLRLMFIRHILLNNSGQFFYHHFKKQNLIVPRREKNKFNKFFYLLNNLYIGRGVRKQNSNMFLNPIFYWSPRGNRDIQGFIDNHRFFNSSEVESLVSYVI